MDRIYGWFGAMGPTLPEGAQETFYHTDRGLAGRVSSSSREGAISAETPWRWDAELQMLSLSRLTADQQPLYYACRKGQLMFSSHLPWLLSQLGKMVTAIDLNCLADLIMIGFVPPPRTQYHGVFQLPPFTQIQWQWGKDAPKLVSFAAPYRGRLAVGVTIRSLPGKKTPEVMQLSNNVMMYNAIPHSAAMLGESHGDLALLRLSLRLRCQRAELAHFRFDGEPLADGSSVEYLLSAPWLKRRWRQRLHDYWTTVRVPEIERWFACGDSMTQAEWQRRLIVTERQRIIRLMAEAYHQQAEFYFRAKDTEQNLFVQQENESFSLEAPEVGSLFCHAVLLGKLSAKMNDYLSLSPDGLRREWGAKNNTQLIKVLCAISSLEYLDKFYFRLPV